MLEIAKRKWEEMAERNQIVCSAFSKGIQSRGKLKLLRVQKTIVGSGHKPGFDAR
jgi:hypothetical protein